MSAATVTYANGMGTAELSATEEDEFVIHGVALGSGDITHGSSQTRKLWPEEELEKAADTLAGQPLVKNHENTVEGKVGTVRDSSFLEGVGVIYEAVIDPEYDHLARKVQRGGLEVSARVYHRPSEELEEDPETGALVTEDLRFDNLSLVLTGASKSNTAEWGESSHLEEGDRLEVEVDELQDEFDFEGEPVELGETDSDAEELVSYSYHTPSYSGTTTAEWSRPDMKDFDTDSLEELDDHFFLSASGFPPDKYTDLSVPVVEPDGQLSLGGLRAAISGHGWQAVDGLDEEVGHKVDRWCMKKAEEEFGKDWDGESGDSEENSSATEDQESILVADLDDLQGGVLPGTRATTVPDDLGLVQVETEFNTMRQNIEDLDNPEDYVAVEEDDLEALSTKASQFEDLDGRLEDLSGNMEDLAYTQKLVHEVGQELVEELAEHEDPVLMESEARERERSMVEEVGQLHADVLADTGPFTAEELMERFSPLELREKVEEDEHLSLDPQVEETEEVDEEEAEYKGTNPESEEELGDVSEEDEDIEAEQLAEVREQAADQLSEMGWGGTADRVRDGEIELNSLDMDLTGGN